MFRSLVSERFERVCRDRADRVAVRVMSTGTAQTFDDLAEQFTAIRRTLRHLGIGRGDVVVTLVGNRPIFIPLFVACIDAGVALVPLGEATDLEAAALVEQARAVAVISDRAPSIVFGRSEPVGDMRVFRLADRDEPAHYGSAVVLKLTSGSTDFPKAAIASELHLVNDARHIVEAMGIGSEDVNFACIPLSHSYALGSVVMPLVWQGSPVALRASFAPAQFVRDVHASGATVFPGVPFMFERLRALDSLDRLPASLRLLITAGARIDPDLVVWFRRRLDRKIHSFYGSSETGGISYDDSDDVADLLHVGTAMPETAIDIRQSGSYPTLGRIFVTGNAVCAGYTRAPDPDAASAFIDGGFLTGDLGFVDPQGRLVLAGRASPLVNVAGRKVDPSEVERRLLELPGIADARVLGIACDTRGQEVVAFLVRTDATLTPITIRQRCAETLSTHKIPRRFVFVDQIPVDARGKVDRRALEQLASSVNDG